MVVNQRLVLAVALAAVWGAARTPSAMAGPPPTPPTVTGWVYRADGAQVPSGTAIRICNDRTGWAIEGGTGRGPADPHKYSTILDSAAGLPGDPYYISATEDVMWGAIQGMAPDSGTNYVPDLLLSVRFGDVDGDGLTTAEEFALVHAEHLLPGCHPEAVASVDYDGDGFISPFEDGKALLALPEPATMSLLAIGLGALVIRRRKLA